MTSNIASKTTPDILPAGLAGRLSGKRLLIVEEALKSAVGHWYEYDKSVCDIHQDLGVATIVAAHATVRPGIRAALPAEPVFAHTNWDNLYAYPQAWRRYAGIAQHNLRVYQTMDRFLRDRGPFDCVFVPTVVIHHIAAWRALVARHIGRRMGRVVLLFRNNIGAYPDGASVPVFKRSTLIWRHALRGFAPHIDAGTVCLATDSDRLATEYELCSGVRPTVFPSPRIALPPLRAPILGDAAKRPYTFGCLGPARFEKGIDLLQAAVLGFLARQPTAHVRFLIQWNQDIVNADGSLFKPDPALLADNRVELVTGEIDSARYSQLLADIDCMVLPYRRESYFARISGVGVEAVTSAVPVIYTEDTWMADLIRDVGAGIGVRSGDVDGLIGALAQAYEQRETFATAAVARAGLAQRQHSAGRFAELLWGLGK